MNSVAKQAIPLLMGPIVAIAVGIYLQSTGQTWPIVCTAAITVWVAIWWVTEPIPIPATSLIPIGLFPLVGVLDTKTVGQAYGSPLVLLMLGGFLLSKAMEKSGAHRRIAIYMVQLFGGGSGRRLVFGFMAASAFLSMWISNAATTLMLLPIALAVVDQAKNRKLEIALLLGIAYAASIGGLGTPVGTPPNLVFLEVYKQNFGKEVSFLQWMTWALPVVCIMLPLAGVWLTRKLGSVEMFELPSAGKWRPEESRTLIVFAITALLWITRTQPFGGWRDWCGLPQANDASVALLAAVALFVIPSGKVDDSNSIGDKPKLRSHRLLDWETAKTVPWGILVLFAGGICIAKAFDVSGLSVLLGESLVGLGDLSVLALIIAICVAVTFLTEVTSNTATTQLLMPILAAAAIATESDPLIFMVPATMSASFAFMLPVSTPPNAIVFGSERFAIRDMVREGFILNLLGIAIVTAICYWQFH
jgi:sodium-dependent dicarboxylate transporter 2/3/5